jgi:hypothetical protein
MHKVERELVKKTKVDEQEDGEDRQDFLKRLCEAVNVLEEDDWEAMSEGAKAWANNATRAIKDEKDLPDFEEAKPARKVAVKPIKAAKATNGEQEAEDEQEEETEEEVEDDEPTPKKAAKPAKEKPRGLSAVAFVRQYVATHPTSDVSEIADAVEKAGYSSLSRSSIGTIRSDFRSIARIIKEQGMLKKGVDLGV